MKGEQFSLTEQHGLEAMPAGALDVLSVGVSTGGMAEMRMAELNPQRHIIATTIDEQGIKLARNMIEQAALDDQISSKSKTSHSRYHILEQGSTTFTLGWCSIICRSKL